MRNWLIGFGLVLLAAAAGACSGGASDTTSDGSAILPTDTVAPRDLAGETAVEDTTPVDVAPDIQPDLGPDVAVDVPGPDVPEGCPFGHLCDDGDPCTYDDRCNAKNECVGTPYETETYDDGRPCTVARCDGFGDWRFEIEAGTCLIDGRCLEDGQSPLDAPCLRCDAGDPTVWSHADGAACDDGDPCTAGDVCREGVCEAGAEALDCDDGNACTDDGCAAGLGCVHTNNRAVCEDGNPCTGPGLCEDGVCRAGAPNDCDDGNPCTGDRCEPDEGCVHWPLPGPCDDGDVCTLEDFCQAGECRPGTQVQQCADGDPCTYDVCDPIQGCIHGYNTAFCDDGNVCTDGDRCSEGVCLPGPSDVLCDDGNECTDDSCDPQTGCRYELNDNPCCENGHNICSDGDPCTTDSCDLATGGCVYEFNNAGCDDGDACTTGDVCMAGVCTGTASSCDDGNPCTDDSCDTQVGCRYTPRSGPCDDGSVCTENDRCQFGICTGTFLNCDDFNYCTDDSCDPVAGCRNEFNALPCDDNDICTTGDACTNGACVGAPDPCDDGDSCTQDSCVNPAGCQHLAMSAGPCDDGIECTVDDHCVAGVCVGDDSGCVCPAPPGGVNVFTSLQIGVSGRPGQGLDLDENPNTCAPPTNCAGGINNSMAMIAGMANPEITDAWSDGKIALLIQHQGLRTDGQPYQINTWPGDFAVEGCAFQTSTCDVLLDPNGFDDDCQPLASFTNATINGNEFHAGGPGYNFYFEIPLMEGVQLQLVLYNATIIGTVTLSGGQVTHLSGLLGGAVPKETLREAVLALPADDLPISPEQILSMLDLFINNDIDTDGDGQPDAASIGILFEAGPANLLGTATD